jgi:elongation factor Ts
VEVTASMVKSLREETGAGVFDCKKALDKFEGNVEKAKAHLKEKGLAAAEKRTDRQVREGLVGTYIHTGSRIAGVVEINCETDFVARTDQFVALARDLAMHVVALAPKFVSSDQIPADVIEEKRKVLRQELEGSGKSAEVVEGAIQGRLDKFFAESCLLSQPFIKDESVTITDLINQVKIKVGENIVVRRFARFEVGEEL